MGMGTTNRGSWKTVPALIPAVGILCGAALAGRLELAVLPLMAIAALALALGGPARGLWWLAVGALSYGLRDDGGEGFCAGVDTTRPVEAVVRVVEHPRRGPFGWSAAGRIERLRQGRVVDPRPREVVLELAVARPPGVGERLRVRGYLARSAGYANRVAIEPGPWRLRVKTAQLSVVEERAAPLMRLSRALRGRVERSLRAAGGGAGQAFARAWILGDVSQLEPEWRRAMRRGGLSHLLAVSGFNVSLAVAFCWLLGAWLPGRWRYGPAVLSVIAYLLLVGPLPPILRAALMAILALAALWLRRPPHAANALAVTVGGLVLVYPELVADVAFQLTVSATAGLVFLFPRFEAAWTAVPVRLRRPLAASVAAQVATLPFVLTSFHQAAPMGVIANLLAVPWSALCLLLSLAWCVLAAACPGWGAASAPLLDVLAAPFAVLASTPPGLWQVQPSALGALPGALLAAALVAVCLRPRAAWCLALVAALGLRCGSAEVGTARIVFLDVGQGDAVLVRDGGHAVLVDGGGWSQGDFGGRVLLPALAGEGLRRLDAIALTHPDRDHCGGLLDLVDYVEVEELWMAPDQAAGCARQLLLRPGPALRVLWAGEERRIGAWSWRALGPAAGAAGSDNGRSLVLMAEANGGRALLAADLEADGERRLLARADERLAADLLKVAHHGSQTSTTAEFLTRCAPRLAVISVGPGNPFGHPHAAVLGRLRCARVPTLRTDLAGEVEVSFLSGGRLRVATPAAPR